MKAFALLCVCALLAAVSATAATAPTVRIASAAPLTITGQSFAPRERLRLVVRFDGVRKVRYLRAAVTGRFTARFDTTGEDRCSIGATVTRANGRTIAAKLPAPLCPPALTP